ncbi:hypothetical protein [Methanosarcina acetivorans]|uniref:hypothetical protein n=1 Tax=Methanosarcina acetivorans TaxID=2214 RepID=UPI00064EAC55|nr:hypothetical protein [Methanosarcina acetivorans]
MSIYDSTPLIVWVGLIFGVMGGLFIIINQAYSEQYKHSNFWVIGFFILILSRIIFLYIPYIRGYYSWRGDNITQLGAIKDILSIGHIPSDNVYPITHILVTEIISVSGLPIEFVVNHSTAFFSAFYVVLMFLLSSAVFSTKKERLFSVAAIGCVLFDGYNIYLMPNGWSLLYLPIFLYFYFKYLSGECSFQFNLLFVIILVLYPFFHPVSSVVIIVTLVVIGITNYLIKLFETKKITFKSIFYHIPLNTLLVELVILVPWILSFQKFNLNIRTFYHSIAKGTGPSAITQMGNTLDKINVNGFEFLKLLFKTMGDELIFLILAFISFILLLRNHNERKNNEKVVLVLALMFSIGLIYLSYLFNIIPGLRLIGSDRLVSYLVLFSPIPVGFTLNHLFNMKINIASVICLIIILMASIISIFSLYPSPYVIMPNNEITKMDMSGAEWLISYYNPSIGTTQIMSPVYRFANGILGIVNSTQFKHREPQVPDHFNYTHSIYLGESFATDKYFMVTMFDRVVYVSVWKVVDRFNDEDFEKLNTDLSVDKIYSNRETNIYYIHNV